MELAILLASADCSEPGARALLTRLKQGACLTHLRGRSSFDNIYNMPKETEEIKKPVRKKKIVPLSVLVDVEIDKIQGMNDVQISKKHNINTGILDNRRAKLGVIVSSTGDTMALERKIISDVISDRLKPIKEELAVKSLEIIRKADNLIGDRLLNEPKGIKMKDLISISDVHSKRLARITGIEEDPGAGDDSPERARFVNNYTQNIFNIHDKKLEEERKNVNNTELKPIYDNDAKIDEKVDEKA